MFDSYAKYYDLLNREKTYELEAEYVAARLQELSATSILELGSGTGRHARLLAARGFHVHGIERSAVMVDGAVTTVSPNPGTFTCQVGDIRSIRLLRSFDAVISLFHVMSYQTNDEDVRAVMATASNHLTRGGLFLFDVWHTPAVLAQKPEPRTRTAANGTLEVKRTARPEHIASDHVVIVNYDFDCLDHATGERLCFSERHPMRYFKPSEITAFATADYDIVGIEEIVTRAPPSEDTWAVTYILVKR